MRRPDYRLQTLLFVLLVPLSRGLAQERLGISSVELCSYFGEAITDDIYSFSSDSEAESFIQDIVDHAGIPQNFVIKAANIPNAAAVIRGRRRLILYSQAFVQRITERTGTRWAATSIMAHEIGHHIIGHTLLEGGSRPEEELEADKFSGFVLERMGASLQEAKAAMETFANERPSETHPPKSARLAAIHNGWLESRGKPLPGPGPAPKPLPPPPPPAPTVRPVETVVLPNVGETYSFDRQGSLSSWNSPIWAPLMVTCGGSTHRSNDSRYIWVIEMRCSINNFSFYVTEDGDVWQDVANWLGLMQRQRVGRATFW